MPLYLFGLYVFRLSCVLSDSQIGVSPLLIRSISHLLTFRFFALPMKLNIKERSEKEKKGTEVTLIEKNYIIFRQSVDVIIIKI